MTQTAGTTTVHAGSTLKSANATATVLVNGGVLTGDGTVLGNVSGTGAVTPGNNNTGTLTVTGTYSSAPSGTLIVNGGTTQLTATGAATLGGTLQLNTANGVPALGTTVTVLTASSVTGTFATVANQDLPSVGGYWAINYTATSVTATVTPYSVITAANAAANEGNGGTSTLNIPVTLDHSSPFTTTVNYATSDGTATAGSDYVATSGTLTFAPGVTSLNVAVTVNGDALYEHDETFTVTLTSPDHGTFGTATATGTIINDDPAPSVSIADAGASVNAAGGATISFPVTLSTASGVDASVQYATADGTAIAGTDYTAESGTLTIPAGSTSATHRRPRRQPGRVRGAQDVHGDVVRAGRHSDRDGHRDGHDHQHEPEHLVRLAEQAFHRLGDHRHDQRSNFAPTRRGRVRHEGHRVAGRGGESPADNGEITTSTTAPRRVRARSASPSRESAPPPAPTA